jgi:hypothetical protein
LGRVASTLLVGILDQQEQDEFLIGIAPQIQIRRPLEEAEDGRYASGRPASTAFRHDCDFPLLLSGWHGGIGVRGVR